jgi:hypothetical protein
MARSAFSFAGGGVVLVEGAGDDTVFGAGEGDFFSAA